MDLSYDAKGNIVRINLVDNVHGRRVETRVDEFGLILDLDEEQRLLRIRVLMPREKLPIDLLAQAERAGRILRVVAEEDL